MIIKLIAVVSCLLILVSGHRHHDHQDNEGRWQGRGPGHDHSHGHRHDHGHGHCHGHGHGHGHGRGHHHGRHHWHRHEPFVNFEVHEPKGLTVSMVQRNPNSTFFGIELFVNRKPEPSNDSQQCDVCHNTTTVTYGKYIVEDEEAIIKKGDALYYFVLLGDSSNVTRSHLQKFWVTDSIINKCNCETTSEDPDIDIRFGKPTEKPDRRPTFGVKPTIPEEEIPVVEVSEGPTSFDNSHSNELSSGENIPFECDLDPTTNLCRTPKKLTTPNEYLEREVDILKSIVEHMRDSCGPRGTTNVLRLQSSGPSTNDIEQLTNVVKSSLSVNPELKELTSKVARVFPDDRMSGVVLFEMVSYVDKQKVLHHARVNKLNNIGDNDLRQFGRPDRRG